MKRTFSLNVIVGNFLSVINLILPSHEATIYKVL